MSNSHSSLSTSPDIRVPDTGVVLAREEFDEDCLDSRSTTTLAGDLFTLLAERGICCWSLDRSTGDLWVQGPISSSSLEEWMEFIHPDDRETFDQFLEQEWAQEDGHSTVEYRFDESGDGDWIRLRHSAIAGARDRDRSLIALVERLPAADGPESGWTADAATSGAYGRLISLLATRPDGESWDDYLEGAREVLEAEAIGLLALDEEGAPRKVIGRSPAASAESEDAANIPAWMEEALARPRDEDFPEARPFHQELGDDTAPFPMALAEPILDRNDVPVAALVAGYARTRPGRDDSLVSRFDTVAHLTAIQYRADVDAAGRLKAESMFRQSEKFTAVGKLATGIAHDFNNLLTVIQGHASLLEASMSEPGEEERASESLGLIRSASRQAVELSRQLLLFSREQSVDATECDLNEIVDEFVKMMRRMVEESIELVFEPGRELPSIHADPSCLGQILMNLIVNARDAMPDGGSITLRTSLVRADAAENEDDDSAVDQVCLMIGDTGKGIPEDQLSHIFDPFFTTKEKGKGTGLGLATVATIVREHGGHIDVTSQPGEGATFELFFPATEGEAAPQPTPESPAGEGAIEGSTVLLVEDESAVRKLVRKLLELHGCQVIEASSGRQALDIWPEVCNDVSVVVTDVVMPEGVSGWDLAAELRNRSPGVAILLTSGYDERPDDHGFGGEPKIAFLQKPYESNNLRDQLSKLLESA